MRTTYFKILILLLSLLILTGCGYRKIYITPKGSRLVLVRENSPFVAVNIFIKGLKAKETKKGLANFSLQMLTRGTDNKNKLTIAHELELMGGELNCTVYNDYALISGFVLKENLQRYLGLLQELIAGANYPQLEINRLRSEIMVQLRQIKEDPLGYAIKLNRQRNYAEHYYAYPAQGDLASINSLSPSEVSSFNLRDTVAAEEVLVVVNGDFNPRQVKREIFDLLSIFKKQTEQKELAKLNPLPSGDKYEYAGYNISNIIYNLQFKETNKTDIKQKPLHALIDSYLGDGLTSPLFQKFREEKGISYAVGSFLDYNQQAEVLTLYLQTKEKNCQPLLAIFDDIVKFQTLPAAGVFQKIKNYHLTNYYLEQQSLALRGRRYGYQLINDLNLNYDYAQEIKKVSYLSFYQSLQSLTKVNALILQ